MRSLRNLILSLVFTIAATVGVITITETNAFAYCEPSFYACRASTHQTDDGADGAYFVKCRTYFATDPVTVVIVAEGNNTQNGAAMCPGYGTGVIAIKSYAPGYIVSCQDYVFHSFAGWQTYGHSDGTWHNLGNGPTSGQWLSCVTQVA